MKDFLGNILMEGDDIVYAVRYGSRLELKKATVLNTDASRVRVKRALTDYERRWNGKEQVTLRTPEYIVLTGRKANSIARG